MAEFPIRTTALDAATASDILQDTWRALFGAAVRPDVLALLLGLWDLETGTGRSMHNNNWGNIVRTSESQDFFVGNDSGNVRKFRHFETPQDGARNFIQQLTRDSRAQWREGLLTGDPAAFVNALAGKNGGPKYFEANPDRYLRTFLGRWQRYSRPSSPGAPPSSGGTAPGAPGRASGALVAVLVIGALAAVFVARKSR